LRIGRGFVCGRDEPSTQMDILISENSKPTLFKDGDLMIVTPDCVKAIIEVKTKLDTPGAFHEVLKKLADQAEKIRRGQVVANSVVGHISDSHCWVGLFIYDTSQVEKGEDPSTHFGKISGIVLQELSRSVGNNLARVINCISIGSDLFIRYWPKGTAHLGGMLHKTGWHSYYFARTTHKRLSPHTSLEIWLWI